MSATIMSLIVSAMPMLHLNQKGGAG